MAMLDRIGEYARKNRNNPTAPEVRLWRMLSGSRLGGFKFRRQYRFGGRIIDFFCPAVNLGVEVDGDTHDAERDAVSDGGLAKAGVRVIRFTNGNVMTNIEGVALTILSVARSLPPRWRRGPHLTPSPEEEGVR